MFVIEKKLKKMVEKSYGKNPQEGWSFYDASNRIDKVKRYHEMIHKDEESNGVIDDITWNDLDMEANGQHSKLISEIPEVDIAISMGCNVGCPFIGRTFDDNWGLEDPTGKSDEEFRQVISQIEKKIGGLKRSISGEN